MAILRATGNWEARIAAALCAQTYRLKFEAATQHNPDSGLPYGAYSVVKSARFFLILNEIKVFLTNSRCYDYLNHVTLALCSVQFFHLRRSLRHWLLHTCWCDMTRRCPEAVLKTQE
jgi:hypothetical protein